MRVAWISSAVAWHSRFSRLALSSANRVLTELVSKMKDMQMDKSELGCLRAIVLFNPGDRVTSAVPMVGPHAPVTEDTGQKPALGEGGVSASGPPLPSGKVSTGRGACAFGAGGEGEGTAGRGVAKRAVKRGQFCRQRRRGPRWTRSGRESGGRGAQVPRKPPVSLATCTSGVSVY